MADAFLSIFRVVTSCPDNPIPLLTEFEHVFWPQTALLRLRSKASNLSFSADTAICADTVFSEVNENHIYELISIRPLQITTTFFEQPKINSSISRQQGIKYRPLLIAEPPFNVNFRLNEQNFFVISINLNNIHIRLTAAKKNNKPLEFY